MLMKHDTLKQQQYSSPELTAQEIVLGQGGYCDSTVKSADGALGEKYESVTFNWE